MRIAIFVFLLIFNYTIFAKNKAIKVGGCQGEACDCFREAQKNPKPEVFDTIRSFTVYKEPNIKSNVLAKHEAKTKAKFIEQFILIEEAGLYKVKKVAKGKNLALKKNDRLSLLLSEGEGFMTAKLKNKTIDFYSEDVELEPIKQTKTSEWIKLKVNNVEGYTQDYPFEGCLE